MWRDLWNCVFWVEEDGVEVDGTLSACIWVKKELFLWVGLFNWPEYYRNSRISNRIHNHRDYTDSKKS